jgi:CRP/FNR family cyclic AMP-dependent transcriptional regulator
VVAELQWQAREEGGRLITGRLTQQKLAQLVGASREMISRIFKELRQGGYIKIENKRIVINKKLPARW